MKTKFVKILLMLVISSLNSCLFLFEQNYTGNINTTLAGHIVIGEGSCYIPTSTITPEEEVAISIVFHLITVGDKYVSVCVSQNNFKDIVLPVGSWIEGLDIDITFYASNTLAEPGSNSVGNSSEVLLSGENQAGQSTSTFTISNYNDGANPINHNYYSENDKCASRLGDSVYGASVWLTDLDMTVFYEKAYIVARVPICGNYPIGSAANPLYSEKHLNSSGE